MVIILSVRNESLIKPVLWIYICSNGQTESYEDMIDHRSYTHEIKKFWN